MCSYKGTPYAIEDIYVYNRLFTQIAVHSENVLQDRSGKECLLKLAPSDQIMSTWLSKVAIVLVYHAVEGRGTVDRRQNRYQSV